MMKSTTVHALFLCLGLYTVKSSVNVAFNKPAWLSSTWTPRSKAENVVDGTKYIDGDTFVSRCVHTQHEPFPRWWVNLTGDYTMARIDINYRGVSSSSMSGYKLIISNTESTTRWNRNHQIDGHICRTETRPNPPVQQTVPCLVRGRFITYADGVRYSTDRYSFVELCELEAFGCPTGWYGPSNCAEQCPEGCRDRVCNPDNGTCFAGCESGLQGKTCNTPCSYGSFGLGCQQSCFCESDPCDPENGTCPGGRCQRGWNGTACDQRCGPQTFGKNCEDTCHCRQGSCDPTNGTCLYDGCEPGWQTESCSEECDHGKFGRECNITCGACRNDDPCEHATGTCPNDCADGWTSPFCNKTCPMGTFGFNCTSECFCKNGTCDPKNGVCPGNACDRGWYGPSCSSQCEAGFFGYNCEESCYCQTESCNRTTGQCPPGGCKDGWQTNTCSQKCDAGFHGSFCNQSCLGNCKSNNCNTDNGQCTVEAFSATTMWIGVGSGVVILALVIVIIVLDRRQSVRQGNTTNHTHMTDTSTPRNGQGLHKDQDCNYDEVATHTKDQSTTHVSPTERNYKQVGPREIEIPHVYDTTNVQNYEQLGRREIEIPHVYDTTNVQNYEQLGLREIEIPHVYDITNVHKKT